MTSSNRYQQTMVKSGAAAASPLTLEPTAGLDMTPISIQPTKAMVLGRSSECDIALADDTQTLSRRHAELMCSGGRWMVRDLGSRHGTSVNGIRINADDPLEVQTGDLLRFGPWCFVVHIAAPHVIHTGATSIATNNDIAQAAVRVEQIPEKELSIRAQAKLDLLLENAGAIGSATTEKALAETVLEVILRGTGFPRGAFVRPLEAAGEVQLVAARDATGPLGSVAFALSRSLLKAASEGRVVRLDAGQQNIPDYGQSISSLGIHSALCAPVMFGGQLVAMIYLDARGSERHVQPDAAAFCSAVAKLAGLSLANLKRAELETRQKAVQTELHAAREAQRLILPPPENTFAGNAGSGFRYSMHSRPGRFVSGDLFDVVPLDGGRLGVFLGDVAGKGAGAAVLMAAAQSHLHAVLRRTGDPKKAVELLNAYLDGRCPAGRFITLFVAVIDPEKRALNFCDAGHGYWLTRQPGSAPQQLHESPGGPPVGVDASVDYLSSSVPFLPGARLILYSDGVHEQQLPGGEAFGFARTIESVAQGTDPNSDVNSLLAALTKAAGPDHAKPNTSGDIAFADDVTIASIELT